MVSISLALSQAPTHTVSFVPILTCTFIHTWKNIDQRYVGRK